MGIMNPIKRISSCLHFKKESMEILDSSQLQPRQRAMARCTLTRLRLGTPFTSSTRFLKSRDKKYRAFPTNTHKMACLRPCFIIVGQHGGRVSRDRGITWGGDLPTKLAYAALQLQILPFSIVMGSISELASLACILIFVC